MKFSFPHRKKPLLRKKLHLELDPRHYWVILLSLFVLVFAAELVYFSAVFLKTSRTIDAPATPTLETNAAKIEAMEQSLKAVEEALAKRMGTEVSSGGQD